MTKSQVQKDPIVGDILELVVETFGDKEIIFGELMGYRQDDSGEYVVIKNGNGENNIFRPSIVSWAILKRGKHDKKPSPI